jgi:L-cysteate sulfo-lyase
MTNVLAGIEPMALGFVPTPLEPLDRISALLNGARLWIKRDDCTGLATGGNKTRKLEYLMGDARARGADTIVTFGAVQSNHARQTAAACAKLGFECHLVLTRRVAWRHPEIESSGNVLIDRLLGAHLHFTEPANAEAESRTLIQRLTNLGKQCYVVPTGGSNAIGALGYMRCAAEIVTQSHTQGFHPDLVVHATSSGGTQAGLVAGFAGKGFPCEVLGINVYDSDHARLEQRVTRLLGETMTLAGLPTSEQTQIRINHDFLGEDYGIPTRQTIAAIELLAKSEGILADPVYSGKALGGLFALMQRQPMKSLKNVLFVHTGGVASLPIYASAFPSDRR